MTNLLGKTSNKSALMVRIILSAPAMPLGLA